MNGSAWQRWHGTAGVVLAVIDVLLSISGVMLNHADALGLRDRYIASDWLLDWYDIHPAAPPVAFAAGGHWVTRMGERLYFDRDELSVRSADLIGAVAVGGNIVVALDIRLLVLSVDGRTVELLAGAEGVPAGMKAVGTAADGRLVVDAAHGRYLPDLELLAWNRGDGIGAGWSVPAAPPAELTADLLRLYRGAGLSLERVLADLHSGRIFGRIGPWAVDLAGILFLFLAASGTWMWLRRPSN